MIKKAGVQDHVEYRGELLAELFLQELNPLFIAKSAEPRAYDFVVGFTNEEKDRRMQGETASEAIHELSIRNLPWTVEELKGGKAQKPRACKALGTSARTEPLGFAVGGGCETCDRIDLD